MIDLNVILNGKYRVEKKLAPGGMSAVYLVRDMNLRKLWVMKAIDSSRDEYKSLLKNGEPDELLILKALDHPLCPRLVDRFDCGPCICLIMDYIEGENLQDYLAREGPVTCDTAAAWMRDVCSILDYLHSNDIIYRDLKPANMVLCHDGHVKLVDFGYPTKIVRNGDYHDDRAFGTPGYAPPEQAKGFSDRRSDIYAAGVTLYQLLTGISPVKKGFKVRSLRKIAPAASFAMDEIVKKAVRPGADDRFQTMAEMIDAIESRAKIEKPYIERLKLKLTVSRAMLICAIALTLSGALIFEAFYMKDLSDYNKLIQRDSPACAASAEDLKRAIALMPGKDEAYSLLTEKYREDGLDDEELAELSALYSGYEDAVFIKKDGYCRLNYDIALAYAAFSSEIPADRCGERLEKVLPYFHRGSGSGTFQAESRAFYNIGNALILDSLTDAQALASFDSARSLLLSSERLIGRGSEKILLVQSQAAASLILRHKKALTDAGISEKSMASLLGQAEENLKTVSGTAELETVMKTLEKARLLLKTAEKKEAP